MSFGSMWNELTGVVPNLPSDYAQTIVRRAWDDVQRKNLWSFLMVEGNWTSPGIVNAGRATVTQGSNTVTFDTAGSNAINNIGLFPSPVTRRQFRIGIGTIYNIWGWDSASTATLDRLYQEPSGTTAYSIYQAYYPSPVADFKAWLSVRDIVNFNNLITTRTRAWVDGKDPQRTIYYIPTHVVPYQTDLNPNSPTKGYQLFELWGQPQFQLTYQLALIRKSVPLTDDSTELPTAIGEDCVMSLSRYYGYQWAELNWKPAWGTKPNLMAMMKEEVSNDRRPGKSLGLFNRLFGEYRMQDRAAVDNFLSQLRRTWSWPNLQGWYSSLAGQASPGAPW